MIDDTGSPTVEPASLLVLVAFTVLAFVLAFPNPTRFHSDIVGNSGDSYFNLWVMRSVQQAFPHGWSALWNLPIYYPAHNTLAYSDTLLPVALIHWMLRGVLGDAGAFNTIYVGSWVLSSWCVYRLARRFVSHWGAAFVAALAYTFASVRLEQHEHFQLVVGGALVPAAVLLLAQVLDRPTPVRGAALGLTVACVALTASYYGPTTLLVLAIVTAGWLVTTHRSSWRAVAVALTVAGLVAAALAAPVALKYLALEHGSHFRRRFEPLRASHFSDLITSGSSNYLARNVPPFSWLARPSHNVEHRMFPGFVALAFGGLGIVATVRLLKRRGSRIARASELTFIGLAGVTSLVLSFGDWIVIHGRRIPLPYTFFRRHVPGYVGIRGLSRLALPAQLGLALFAAVGIDMLLRRTRRPRWRLAATAGLTLLVVAESAIAIQYVRIPTSRDDGGVDDALRRLPRGVVLELPIASSSQLGWIYNEPSRQLLALRDGDARVNGYSGFEPPGFPSRVALLNRFPAQEALAAARKLGVRYVVLRTRLVGEIKPTSIGRQLAADGAGRYDDSTAQRLISELPPGAATRVDKLAGAYLIELE